MLSITIVFIIGILIGSIATNAIYQQARTGTLRVDTSDPEDGPYMFLEIDKGVENITSKRYILLKVDLHSYLPHK